MFDRKKYIREWARRWRAKNRLKARAIGRKSDKRRRLNNKRRGYMKVYLKKYYKDNRKKQLQAQKDRYRKDRRFRNSIKLRAKLWVKNHPLEARQNSLLRCHRRIARLKSALGKPFTKKEWLDKVETFHWRCCYCNRKLTTRSLEMDHVVPLIRGGQHELTNLVPSCRKCNARKGAMFVEDFQRKEHTADRG